MIAKSEPVTSSGTAPFTNDSINRTSQNRKAFRPSKLPTNLLNQLHEIARERGRTDLVRTIEDEIFKREEIKIELRDYGDL